MNRKAHIAVQLILLALQLVNALTPLFANDLNKKAIALAVIAFLQGAVGVINQAFNTDGTPQTTAFKETK